MREGGGEEGKRAGEREMTEGKGRGEGGRGREERGVEIPRFPGILCVVTAARAQYERDDTKLRSQPATPHPPGPRLQPAQSTGPLVLSLSPSSFPNAQI